MPKTWSIKGEIGKLDFVKIRNLFTLCKGCCSEGGRLAAACGRSSDHKSGEGLGVSKLPSTTVSPVSRWASDLSRYWGQIQTSGKPVERCVTPLAFTDMQIEPHGIPPRTFQNGPQHRGGCWEAGSPLRSWQGRSTEWPLCRAFAHVCKTCCCPAAQQLHSRAFSPRNEIFHTDSCTWMFMLVLFVIAQTCKEPNVLQRVNG